MLPLSLSERIDPEPYVSSRTIWHWGYRGRSVPFCGLSRRCRADLVADAAAPPNQVRRLAIPGLSALAGNPMLTSPNCLIAAGHLRVDDLAECLVHSDEVLPDYFSETGNCGDIRSTAGM